jgi:hypothetical protein
MRDKNGKWLNTIERLEMALQTKGAIQIYCEGVAEDFPQLKSVMDNIMILAGISKPA